VSGNKDRSVLEPDISEVCDVDITFLCLFLIIVITLLKYLFVRFLESETALAQINTEGVKLESCYNSLNWVTEGLWDSRRWTLRNATPTV
jgi:hypothetical protein